MRKRQYRNGDVSLQRSDGWYVASWKDGSAPRQRHRLIKETEPEAKARVELDRFAEGRRAVVAVQQSYTVGELWKLWLEDRKKDGLNNKTHDSQWMALKKYFENRAPHLLTRDDGREYSQQRFAEGKSSATVHTEIARLRTCLNWAVDTNKIAKPQKIWAPSKGKGRTLILTPLEARRLVDSARDDSPHHILVFIALAFSTAARHMAILDLEWPRVNFEAGTINLDVDLPRDKMSKASRKGRADVVMSDLARTVLLEAYRARTACGYVVEYGGRRVGTVKNGFAHAVERAGLNPDITPHTIRHTVASWVSHKNVDVKHTAHLLGHSDDRTTKGIYIHNEPETSRPAVQVIDATFESSLPALSQNAPQKLPKKGAKRQGSSTIDKGENPSD
jgi:integrase